MCFCNPLIINECVFVITRSSERLFGLRLQDSWCCGEGQGGIPASGARLPTTSS